MRKFTVFCLLGLVMLFLFSQGMAVSLTWNEVNDETYGAAVAAKVFSEKIEELSGGSIEIELHLNGELGSEAESMQGIQWGTLDIFRGNASSLTDYGAEILGATGLPYLFKDMTAFEKMAESPLGQEALDNAENSGCDFIALAWLVEGPRNLFITQKVYEQLGSPDHFELSMMKDLFIRVPGSQLLTQTISALGAEPVEIVYSELVNSLKAGNIDGAENGIISYVNQGFSGAAPYYITDAHMFGCGVILVSKASWESLSEEQQEWMREAGKAASEACYTYNLEQEQAIVNSFESIGVKLLPVTDIEAWQAACADVYAGQNEAVQTFIQKVRELE